MLEKICILIVAIVAPSVMTQHSCWSKEETNTLPNVIVILADDLGFGDLSCYGASKISTPNIDRLAKQGLRFTNAHSAASLCSPSRYGLLTGRSPWRLHKKGNGFRLKPGQTTLGSIMRDAGYRTATIGKWHLGYGKDWNSVPIMGPLEVGFDYHFGVPSNHNDSTRAFIENHDIVGREPGTDFKIVKGRDFPEGLAKPRIEDEVDSTLTKKAIAFIRRNSDRPFFLYFAPCCPHTHVTPNVRFRGSSKAGLYGDYIQELDSHVGEIVSTLDELKLSENTLLIFTSDNGSTPKDFRGTQGVHLNLADDSGDIRKRFKTAKADAKKLGHVTNGPWRDGKGYAYEGGHHVPFIAHWPKQIRAGGVSDCLINLTDIFATAASVAGQPLPTNCAEDSFSMAAVLRGEQENVANREAIFVLGNGKDSSIAICSGKWKLIYRYGDAADQGHELYDLESDPGEQVNLTDQYPEKSERLVAAMEKAEADGRTRN